MARLLTVVEGTGLDLEGEDLKISALQDTPVAFSGDIALQAQPLDGMVRAFNVMCAWPNAKATAQVVSGAALTSTPSKVKEFEVFVIDGAVSVTADLRLSRQDVLIVTQASANIQITAVARALIIAFQAAKPGIIEMPEVCRLRCCNLRE